MSYGKFQKEAGVYSNWRRKNNLPNLDWKKVDEIIRDKWISDKRYKELIAFIIENWESGNGDDFVRPLSNNFLKVVLSTDKKPREFTFIETDYPILTATDTLNYKKDMHGFIVTNFGENLTPTIIIQLDDQIYRNNKELNKMKIKTKNVLISFENGNPKYDSF